MIVEKFFKKTSTNKSVECCDKLSIFIDNLLKDIRYSIEYDYFEDVNNVIFRVKILEKISNFDEVKFDVKNNLKVFNNFVDFFSNKCEIVMYPSNGAIQFQLIFYNNIQKVLNDINITETSKKYNL